MSFNPELRKERNFIFVVLIIFAIVGAVFWWMYKHPWPDNPALTSSSSAAPEPSAALQNQLPAPTPAAENSPPQPGYFTLIVVERSTEADLINAEGVAKARRSAYVSAVEDFDKAIAADPHKAIYRMNRAEALRILEFPDRAVRDLTEARKLEPENVLVLNKLLLAQIENGERRIVEDFLRENVLADANKHSGPRGLAAAAVLALQVENTKKANAYLLALQEKLSPDEFRILLCDRQLARFANLPELQRFFVANLTNRGTP